MSYDVAEIRRRLADPIDVVTRLGLDRGARRERGGVRILCPAHRERSPSCSVTLGRDGTIRVRCWACGWTGDVLHLVGAAHGLDVRTDFGAVVREAAALAGVQPSGRTMRPAPPRPVVVQIAHRIAIATADFLDGREVRADDVIERATARQLDEALALLADLDGDEIAHSLALDMVGDDSRLETRDERRLAALRRRAA